MFHEESRLEKEFECIGCTKVLLYCTVTSHTFLLRLNEIPYFSEVNWCSSIILVSSPFYARVVSLLRSPRFRLPLICFDFFGSQDAFRLVRPIFKTKSVMFCLGRKFSWKIYLKHFRWDRLRAVPLLRRNQRKKNWYQCTVRNLFALLPEFRAAREKRFLFF